MKSARARVQTFARVVLAIAVAFLCAAAISGPGDPPLKKKQVHRAVIVLVKELWGDSPQAPSLKPADAYAAVDAVGEEIYGKDSWFKRYGEQTARRQLGALFVVLYGAKGQEMLAVAINEKK